MTALAYLDKVDERVGGKAKALSTPMRYASTYISEPPPSNDNQAALPDIRELHEVEAAVEKQHARISELMHKRNASPHDEQFKQELSAAFATLEELEDRRADLLIPYTTIKAPSFSEEALRVIDKAERLWREYEQSHSTENDTTLEGTDPKEP